VSSIWSLSLLLSLGLAGCRNEERMLTEADFQHGQVVEHSKFGVPTAKAPAESRHVLVVVNQDSPISRKIAEYYCAKRKIPTENTVVIHVKDQEPVTDPDYLDKIEKPVKAAIKQSKTQIDYIVTTKGIPIRIGDANGYSVDSCLMAMNRTQVPTPPTVHSGEEERFSKDIERNINPYGGLAEEFSSKKFNLYLTCRLDGYEWADIKALVDNSLTAKPSKGLFYFNKAANRTSPGYVDVQKTLDVAHKYMGMKGLKSQLVETPFSTPKEPLMGYGSWGSNDSTFNKPAYRAIKFLPGSIAETFVSTSARTFFQVEDGQSLIGDLIHQGVTGVKGYVAEPYAFSLCHVDVLMDRYTGGFNLAESFYMASPMVHWKDVVIGDPLCRPYPRSK